MSSAAPQPYLPRLTTTPAPSTFISLWRKGLNLCCIIVQYLWSWNQRERRGKSTNSNCSGLRWDRTTSSISNCREIKEGDGRWSRAKWEWETAGTTFGEDDFTGNASCALPPPSPHSPAVPRLGQWPRVHAPNALTGAQGLARMEPIQQPASRCLPKQSSRLEREQRAGKGDRNLIACH